MDEVITFALLGIVIFLLPIFVVTIFMGDFFHGRHLLKYLEKKDKDRYRRMMMRDSFFRYVYSNEDDDDPDILKLKKPIRKWSKYSLVSFVVIVISFLIMWLF